MAESELGKKKEPFFHSGMIGGIAVFSLTLLFVTLIPVIGPGVIIMTPLPVIYHYSRLGRIRGLLALSVAFFVVLEILNLLGHHVNISILLMIGFIGVMLSEILKRCYSIEKTCTLASLALFFCGVGFVLNHSYQSGTAPWQTVEFYVTGVIRENLKLYEQLNLSPEQANLLRENVPQIIQFFTDIFPALALSGAVLTVWMNVLAGRSLLTRNGIGFPDFGDLTAWKAPEKLVWVLIVSGGMVLLAPMDILSILGLNCLIICCLFYLFQGLAIVSFFFKRKQVPVFFCWLFYFLIVIQQYMLILVIALGLFDLWVDFRKRITTTKDVHA